MKRCEEEAAEEEEELKKKSEEEAEDAGAAIAAANLAQLKADALERFAVIREAVRQDAASTEKKGYRKQGLQGSSGTDFQRTDAIPFFRQAGGSAVRHHARPGGRSAQS